MTRVLSGIQPTGEVHLGNYIGALRHWAADQYEHDAYYCIVDLHAITLPQEPAKLRQATVELAALLLAVGIEPERATLFVQSHVPEHAELAWILNCVATFGELRRMTQFKDKAAKQKEASVTVGLFDYPVLQAADILIYQADRVPVGEDQRQHLELTRDIAQRFNARFGETFNVPSAAIPKLGAKIMDLQTPTAKMSKSTESPQGTVKLTDPPDAIAKKVKVAVTDSGREIVYDPGEKPAISNLLTILSVATQTSIEDLQASFEGKGYADLKRAVTEGLVEFLAPIQDRYREFLDDPAELGRVLGVGATKAQKVAGQTMRSVYERVGFLPRA
jgi:tryptophanyl-tRNA synthetase